MSARHDRRADIERIAKQSFENHVLTPVSHDATGQPYAWRCAQPGTSQYAFYVMEGPGCIVQWGDVGDLLIAQGRGYDLAWLEDAINSMDYVLGKSIARQSEFIDEMFQEYVREHAPDFEFEYDGSEMDAHRYYEETGDSEFSSCSRDWPGDVLWAYWALHTFVRLRKAARGA